jgi:ubiquinone/menaquinone biosynthesis C-methylase UbiE
MKRSTMALTFVSLGLIIIVPLLVPGVKVPEAVVGWLWAAGLLAIVWGVMIALGFKKVPLPWGAIDVPEMDHTVFNTPPRELPREVVVQRRDYAEQKEQQLPGRFAPAFQLLDEKLAFTVTPCADRMTPMYILDREFRIMDWNIAFSLCFDRTLEGRRGRNDLEWTYFLDNYEDVVNHGIGVFGPGKEQPRIDIEEIRYTSYRYGPINGTKRAYQIPGDDGECLGWLITKPNFVQDEMATLHQADLFSALRKDLMWSEYALCYDKVLNKSLIYPALINTLIGHHNPGPAPIPERTVVLDLGAGTGNLTCLLAERSAGRLVVSVENNAVMLNVLRQKCGPFLREDTEGPGVIAIKQDVSSLYGLNDDFFDYVVLNNVLYSLEPEAAKACLKEAHRVLKPGGELRFSEPKKGNKLSKVLDQIYRDLKGNNRYAGLEKEYQKVRQINEFALAPLLHRWSLEEIQETLRRAIGFTEITYAADNVYAGQSMLVCAQK